MIIESRNVWNNDFFEISEYVYSFCVRTKATSKMNGEIKLSLSLAGKWKRETGETEDK